MVYFIQQGEAGPIKIGYTRNINKRLSQLQTANPEKLHLRLTIPGTFGTEKVLHDYLKPIHIRGEWYECDPVMRHIMKALEKKQIELEGMFKEVMENHLLIVIGKKEAVND